MKKIYTLLGAALITSSSFAQMVTPVFQDENTSVTPEEQIMLDKFTATKVLQNKISSSQINKGPVSGRADYAARIFDIAPSVEYTAINPIMPDSTTLTVFSNATINTRSHGYGMVYDPTDTYYDASVRFKSADIVNVDSVLTDGFYYRNNPAHTNDSLIFTVYIGNVANAPFRNVTTIAPALGYTNALTIPYLEYTGSAADGVHNGLSTPVGRYAYNILPTDSVPGSFTAAVATPGLTIPAGSVMGVFVEYIPTAFAANDTFNLVDATGPFNAFRPLVVANVNDTDPLFNSMAGIANGSNQHNSIRLNNVTRYDPNATYTADAGTNSYFPSSFTYSVYAYVSGNSTVGVDEVNNNVKFNVFPNPSNGDFNINISSNEDNNVNLTVKNVVGQTVLTETVNVSGTTNHKVSLADYSNGIYFLTVGNETVKLIVE